MNDGALNGVRVIDGGDTIATAFCSRLLADRGADVVAVEAPGGSPLRTLDGTGELHKTLTARKRSITLDTTDPTGARLFAELLGTADVLVEDSVTPKPTASARESVKRKLVTVSITPFGRTGPRAGWKGGDLVGWAAGGLAHGSGEPAREPLRAGGNQAEHLAGLSAAASALIALWHAAQTGEGQRVDVSRQEAVAGALECTTGEYSITGTVRQRMGTHHPVYHGLGRQQMRDGRWILFGTMPTERMWAATTELIGSPAWAREERWIDSTERRRHAEEIDALAADAVKDLDTDEIISSMKQARLPVGLIRDMAAVAASPQLRDRGYFVTGAGAAFGLADDELRAVDPGEHNQAVLIDELGHPGEELARWRDAGVI